MIFVFGSNLAGIHGGGAAYAARHHRNFPMHCGEGLANNCYALPTKSSTIETLPLHVVEIKVRHFLNFAHEILDIESCWSASPEVSEMGHTQFQVTRVGCGLAGLRDEDIAPMFRNAPNNCLFDTKWESFLPTARFWGTF